MIENNVFVSCGNSAIAAFLDPGWLDTHRAVMDWGDGMTETLDLVSAGGDKRLACARCGSVLCHARENYKAHALRIDRPIEAANPLIGDPSRFIDAAVQFRQFYCPACGGLLENEVCRAEDPLLWDIELAVP